MYNFLINAVILSIAEIGDAITNFVKNACDVVVNGLCNLPWWAQLLILIAVAIIVIAGIIALIVKSWKFLLVLIVLGGIGVAVYFIIQAKGASADTLSIVTTTVRTLL